MSIAYARSRKFKQSNPDANTTLDVCHDKEMNKLSKQTESLPKFEKSLTSKKKQLKSLEDKYDIINVRKRKQLILDIENLNEKIENIKSGTHISNYVLNTSDILFNYYENNSEPNQKDKIDFFEVKKNDVSLELSDDEINSDDENCINYKNDILENYRNSKNKNLIYRNKETKKNDICMFCKINLVVISSESILSCPECGLTKSVVIESDKPVKCSKSVDNYYAYKRINHFKEWLSQVQAREHTKIPDEIYDQILIELKKNRINNLINITPEKLRKILRKLRLNKYYENIPQIICSLTNIKPFTISRDIEAKLCEMFMLIQAPFREVAPKKRKNFLSYSFILNRFMDLLELHELKDNFKLLKSRSKLKEQDKIWKEICIKLGWEFRASI